MIGNDTSPLYQELTDDAIETQEECPGVQYLCIERRDNRPTEYYIVDKNSPVISDEAKRYGKLFADRPDLLMYVLDDATGGKAIVRLPRTALRFRRIRTVGSFSAAHG